MFRRRLAFCASVSAGSYLLLSAPHYARRSEENEAVKVPRPPPLPKKPPTQRPLSPLYSPLLEEKSQIRLLSLRHDSPSDDLRCDLNVVSLDAHPQFYALSYTWGEPINHTHSLWTLPGLYRFLRELYRSLFVGPRTIFVNGQPFSVTDNLHAALTQLRGEEHALPFWIDQICINQGDPDEKASQVGLMATIYDRAARTYIWLGPRADASDDAMDFINAVHERGLLGARQRQLHGTGPVPGPALHALFARSWWERIWVVQEMFLSRRATVKCGAREADLAAFASVAALADGDDGAVSRHFGRAAVSSTTTTTSDGEEQAQTLTIMPPDYPFRGLLRLWGQRAAVDAGHATMWLEDALLSAAVGLDGPPSLEKRWQMPAMGLWQWVYQTQRFRSTMRRDRVFALLGIARKEDRDSVRVSYPEAGADDAAVERGDCEIFTEAAVWMINNEKNLDVLQLSWPGNKALGGLPSWVPDFSTVSGDKMDTLMLGYRADGGPLAWSKLTPNAVVAEKYYDYSPSQSLDWAARRLLWILPFQLLLLRWPRAPGKWMAYAVPIQAGWLINSLFQGHTEYGQKTRPAYRADLALSEDGKRIRVPGLVVDRIDVVDVAPNLGAIASEEQSPRALERQRRQVTKLLAKWEALALGCAANPYRQQPGGKHEAFWRVVATNGLRGQGFNLMYPSTGQAKRFGWAKAYGNFTDPSGLGTLSQRLTKEEMEEMDRYGTAVIRNTTSRALVVTKGGFLGLGPQSVQQGDLLCLLRGGRVPFVLRAHADGTYRLVGDCYVQGLMEGEHFGRGKVQRDDIQTFELC